VNAITPPFTFAVHGMSQAIEEVRICRKVLRMVMELHLRGFQRLRIVPHLYELGTWRCGITPVTNIRRDHGALPCSWDWSVLPQYSSASGREYFGWKDLKYATPSMMAECFLQRFPEISAEGAGQDWEYAGWFVWMLHLTYPGSLPIAQAPFHEIPSGWMEALGGSERLIHLPPPRKG